MLAFMAEFESLVFSTWDDFPWNGPFPDDWGLTRGEFYMWHASVSPNVMQSITLMTHDNTRSLGKTIITSIQHSVV